MGGTEYILVDTAGIRRKTRISLSTERYSVIRAFKAVERADVALIVIDATEGVTEQDQRIAGFVHEQGRASVIVVNKWDSGHQGRQDHDGL
jgi:GTP-binding protein